MTKLINKMDDQYLDYLSDESKLKGNASSISFPSTEDEVVRIIKELNTINFSFS